MSIPAAFDSLCNACRRPIDVGQQITRPGKGRFSHSDCSNPDFGKDLEGAMAARRKFSGASSREARSEVSVSKDQIEQIIKNLVEGQMTEILETAANSEALDQKVRELVDTYAGPLQVKVIHPEEFHIDPKVFTAVHNQVKTLLALAGLRHDIFTHGEPGSGKSFAAKQVADMLTLEYSYISLEVQTPASRLVGYMDANGHYVRTLFRDRYEFGGVFCIDEMDNASGNLLTFLNSALGNGYGAFPDGMIKRHENFICVATGNTTGRGGNVRFPERRVLDSAFLDRFTSIEWAYDLKLEEDITLMTNPEALEWLRWIRRVRKYVMENGIRLIVSPRASFKGAELLRSNFTPTETADMVLFKGLDKDIVKRITDQFPLPVK